MFEKLRHNFFKSGFIAIQQVSNQRYNLGKPEALSLRVGTKCKLETSSFFFFNCWLPCIERIKTRRRKRSLFSEEPGNINWDKNKIYERERKKVLDLPDLSMSYLAT